MNEAYLCNQQPDIEKEYFHIYIERPFPNNHQIFYFPHDNYCPDLQSMY